MTEQHVAKTTESVAPIADRLHERPCEKANSSNKNPKPTDYMKDNAMGPFCLKKCVESTLVGKKSFVNTKHFLMIDKDKGRKTMCSTRKKDVESH